MTRQPIVRLERFIQATRDSGYKGTSSAIAELVDNALQAKATAVRITLDDRQGDAAHPVTVSVADNGQGMTGDVLAEALRFGGSSRFNDRRGLGRFGMGLPNASLSQSRRVEVFTWQRGKTPIWNYLDVDEIASGELSSVPRPKQGRAPAWTDAQLNGSGTVVVWRRCDRLDNRRISTISRKLAVSLGRIFRYFLWSGVRITINGDAVKPVDPLFLHEDSLTTGAEPFQDTWTCEVSSVPGAGSTRVGQVHVSFSELPVHRWSHLPNQEKRRLGVSDGAGVSIVRADREVDYGWFFMGAKRRENYDDWWRCEIRFDPALDEAFGVTHTKQQIRPKPHLVEALQSHIEPVARALNSRTRKAHQHVATTEMSGGIESKADGIDHRLRPMPKRQDPEHRRLLEELARRDPVLAEILERAEKRTRYRVLEEELSDPGFFKPVIREGVVVAVVNPRHPFYSKLYQPLLEMNGNGGSDLREAIQALLLAAARAEGLVNRAADRRAIAQFRTAWSGTLATLLR